MRRAHSTPRSSTCLQPASGLDSPGPAPVSATGCGEGAGGGHGAVFAVRLPRPEAGALQPEEPADRGVAHRGDHQLTAPGLEDAGRPGGDLVTTRARMSSAPSSLADTW